MNNLVNFLHRLSSGGAAALLIVDQITKAASATPIPTGAGISPWLLWTVGIAATLGHLGDLKALATPK